MQAKDVTSDLLLEVESQTGRDFVCLDIGRQSGAVDVIIAKSGS